MNTYFAFLRGINVSGQKKIKMADLRVVLEGLGFHQVKTYIQSGNVIFNAKSYEVPVLIQRIENAILQTFGFEVAVLIRTRQQLERMLAESPFKNPDDLAANKIYYVLLQQPAQPDLVQSLAAAKYPNEQYHIAEECIYLACKNGYGKAKLNNNLFERKLQVVGTTRNHRTMLRLLEMTAS